MKTLNTVFNILLLCLILTLFLAYTEESETERKVTIITNKEVNSSRNMTTEVYNYAKKIGIKYPKVVCAQAIHETAYFTSDVYKINNNLFGMHVNGRGFCEPSNLKEADGSFCKYSDWKKSVEDYKVWQDLRLRLYFKKFPSEEINTDWKYIKFLEHLVLYINGKLSYPHRYATDKEYSKKITNFYREDLKYLDP